MLGFGDISVLLAFVLCVISMIAGIIYGALHWNSQGELSETELQQESKWMKDEIEIDEEISGGSL